jgi:hypothetical protein
MSYIPSNPNGSATSANSAPVVIASDQSTIPVSGPLTNAQLRATPVSISGTVTTNAGTGTMDVSVTNELLNVGGSVSVSNFPATQPVSGPLTDTQLRATPVPISGTVTANAGTGTQNVSVQNASIAVTGTFFQATQPISGTVDTELPAAVPLSDSTANPTAPHIGSCIEGFNGTTWDRLRTDTALQGNGANDTVVGVLAAGSGPGFSIRINPTNLATAANSVSAFNVDGANSVTIAISTTTTGTFIIEGTADNTNWVAPEVFDGSQDIWVSGQNIVPAAARVYQVLTQGYRQIRLRTVTTLGATVQHFVTLSTAQQFLGGIDTGPAPHNFGYVVRNFGTEYTTTQTGAAIWTPTTGRRFVVTDFTISTGGATAGVVTLWQGAAGDTTYNAGTDPVVFRGEFAPSASARPGVVKAFAVPWMSTTVDHVLRITTSAAITLYVQVNGYEI